MEWFSREADAQPLWESWSKPHRATLPLAVECVGAKSLYEIGCGPGPNLRLLRREFPELRLGGCEVNPGHVRWAVEHLATPVERAELPRPIGSEWDVTLSCYVLSYCPPQMALAQLDMTRSPYLILMEPWGDSEIQQHGDSSVPRYYHAWLKLLNATGWSIVWRWPVPPIDDLQALTIAYRLP